MKFYSAAYARNDGSANIIYTRMNSVRALLALEGAPPLSPPLSLSLSLPLSLSLSLSLGTGTGTGAVALSRVAAVRYYGTVLVR